MPKAMLAKIVRDIVRYKFRSLLAVFSLIVGMAGAASVINTYAILQPTLDEGFLATNPATLTLKTQAIDNEFLKQLKSLSYISEVEARRFITLYVSTVDVNSKEQYRLVLSLRHDIKNSRIDQVKTKEGVWPPKENSIVIESSSLPLINSKLGDRLFIETRTGEKISLKISGISQESGLAPGWMDLIVYGHIHPDTVAVLGESHGYDVLKIVFSGDRFNKVHIKKKSRDLKVWIEQTQALNGEVRTVEYMKIPEPKKHIHSAQMESFLFIQSIFGILLLLLSGILLFKMISAVLAEQMRDIGVMKAHGASRVQVFWIYASMVLILNGSATFVALPLANWVAVEYAAYLAQLLNFNTEGRATPAAVLFVEAMFGLLLPLLLVSASIIKSSRLSVAKVLSDYGIKVQGFGENVLQKLVTKLSLSNRMILLGLRNSLRQRARLLLTLITLAIGGMIFIAALNIRSSIAESVNRIYYMDRFDHIVELSQFSSRRALESLAKRQSQVISVESRIKSYATIKKQGHNHGEWFSLFGVNPDSEFYRYDVDQGRWLTPQDTNAIVLNRQLIDKEPDIKIGDEISLRVGGQYYQFKVVGMVTSSLLSDIAYVNRTQLERLLDKTSLINNVVMRTVESEITQRNEFARFLKDQYIKAGYDGVNTYNLRELLPAIEAHMLMALNLLFVMAFLIVAVGGLAVASTMSINVMERGREIAVMRSMGGSKNNILQIIFAEGLFIGLLSWLLAVLLCMPVTEAVGSVFTEKLFRAPLIFNFEFSAAIIWLALVLLISMLASYFPARRASRLTIKDVLVYG